MTRRPAHFAAAATLLLAVSGITWGNEPDQQQQQATRPADGTSEAELRASIRLEEIRRAEAAYRATALVRRAERAEAAGRDAEAAELYAEATELDSSDQRAQLGLRATRDRLGLLTERVPLLERTEREANIRRQEVMYRFNAAMTAALDGIVSGRPEGFQKARLEIDHARLARDSAPSVFSAEALEDLDARLGDHDIALNSAIQRRADAIEAARQKDRARRIKAARVHDIRLEL